MATRGATRRRAPTVPVTMRAAAVDRFGPPAALRVRMLPVPEPGSREVLIALHAAGVGVWEGSIRDGTWQPAGFAVEQAEQKTGLVIGVYTFRLEDAV